MNPDRFSHPARMGLQADRLSDWLVLRDGDKPLLGERARLLAAREDQVLACHPDGESAVRELVRVLEVAKRARIDPALDARAALGEIGRQVVEDICVLTPGTDGSYVLTAGILCFPNRWRLSEKMGKPVVSLHDPVPDYRPALGKQVDQFMTKLLPMRHYTRHNWGLADRGDFHLPEPGTLVNIETSDPIFVREEHQSFLKLPSTQAVIFSIRTEIRSWRDLGDEERTAIAAAVGTLSPVWLRYKGIAR
jgi:hypothetical protein